MRFPVLKSLLTVSTLAALAGAFAGAALATGALVAGAGDDSLTATAASVLYGGAGNDSFDINATMITALQSRYGSGGNMRQLARIDGGSGIDKIVLSGSGLRLDLTQIDNQAGANPDGGSRIDSIEKIVMAKLAAARALGLPVKTFQATDYNGVIQAVSSGQVEFAQMGAGRPVRCAAGRKALTPTAATYKPSSKSGQLACKCGMSHKPSTVPNTSPGTKRRNSRHCTCRQFSPL